MRLPMFCLMGRLASRSFRIAIQVLGYVAATPRAIPGPETGSLGMQAALGYSNRRCQTTSHVNGGAAERSGSER